MLASYLEGYPNEHIKNKLIMGFTEGFSIGCSNVPPPHPLPPNSQAVLDKLHIAQAMVDEEVNLGHMLGPYTQPPIPNLICSPLNLVPKAGDPDKHRLIHNLAHPYNKESINTNIPDTEATVTYIKFDKVIKLTVKHGKEAVATKLDFDSTFRLFPIIYSDLCLLGFTLNNLFYINCAMAFGSRSSCKIFEEFACAIQWCLEQITRSNDISHYLDDFIMIHRNFSTCLHYKTVMQNLCKDIGAPLSAKKTVGPVNIITFLGLLLDLSRQVIMILQEKITKTLDLINQAMESKQKANKNQRGKVTVKLMQQLTGTLNFLCRAIHSGRPFIGRMYRALATVAAGGAKPNPSFKIRLNKGLREDLAMWKKFLGDLTFPKHREIPFTIFLGDNQQGPLIFVDSAGKASRGFGFVFLRRDCGLVDLGRENFFSKENQQSCY